MIIIQATSQISSEADIASTSTAQARAFHSLFSPTRKPLGVAMGDGLHSCRYPKGGPLCALGCSWQSPNFVGRV